MAAMIGCVSQKGGVGKSTLARLLAREFAQAGWRVLIGDTDARQTTSGEWVQTRQQARLQPEIHAATITDPRRVDAGAFDLLIFDGQPASSRVTLEIANLAALVVIPTGCGLDDLKPSVLLGHELLTAGVPPEKIIYALCRAGTELEIAEARAYIESAGYRVASGAIPEMAGYRMAQNHGRALTETQFESLNARAAEVAQSVIDVMMGESHG